ncbi:hypothetical protein [uncultured Dokdonia sp.]|uniref:hypothetical protein n=1 Tax=uncultured Dokdonia sp. TaxID=575653 RepID=UPI002616290A|nr:hypothetical protein [uncultured Dokdonia sp.]
MSTIDEKNFGVVVLKSNMNNKNQSIYSSNLYKTSFNIYGNFSINNDGTIASIDLQILNYKGIIDLGFDRNEPVTCKYQPIKDDEGNIKHHVIVLNLTLKAVVGGSTDYMRPVDIDENLAILSEINQNEDLYFQVHRGFNEIWDQSEGDKSMDKGIFDEEFFYRDGTHFKRRMVTKVPEELYQTHTNRVYPQIDFLQKPGFNCGIGNNKIIRY